MNASNSFFSFLKMPGLRNEKNHQHQSFDNHVNKNEAINNNGF